MRDYLHDVKYLFMKWFLLVFLFVSASVQAQTFIVVRHGEKAVVAADATAREKSDPPLSEAGLKRAERLANLLADEPIVEIWSTNYKRTQSTVAVVAENAGVRIQIYSSKPDSTAALIQRIKGFSEGVFVIAGHSNTLDDIVNFITGEIIIPADLDESEYDNLFVLRKEGEKFVLERRKY